MIIPRDYQNVAIDAIYKFFQNHPTNSHPIVKMPTGTGKSVVIAEFLRRAFLQYSNQRVIIGTHVKELVEQNYLEFMGMWPTAPAGIYSAGLKRKDLFARITFAGVASIVKNIEKFGKIDLFLIDECHLLSPEDESMYMKCIQLLLIVNPNMKVIGFTATDWREGIGRMTEGGTLFTHVAIDMCDEISFNWFIKQGYLIPLIPKRTESYIDVDGLKIVGGEYAKNQLQIVANKDEITFSALQETLRIATAEGRKHWLIFAAGLEHVKKIYEMLQYLGVSCRTVHSKMPVGERDKNIKDFKAGEYTALINNGILTTGFNYKAIDLIVMLRPTASSKLWVQMLGRGTRPDYAPGFDLTTLEGRFAAIEASEKQNCLVLDFARNSERLGPINDPVIPKKKGEGKGDVPIKICEECGMYNHISARFCGGSPFKTPEGCGAEFLFRVAITHEASTAPLIKDQPVVIETFQVTRCDYNAYVTRKGDPAVQVTYYSGLRMFKEYVMFEKPGFPRRKATLWWQQRSNDPVPENVPDALLLLQHIDPPTHIRVRTDQKYPEVTAACFMGEFATAHVGEEVPF